VEAVTTTTVTLLGSSYVFDPLTQFKDDMGGERHFRFDRIRGGDRLEIRGIVDAQGNIVATVSAAAPPRLRSCCKLLWRVSRLPIWAYVALRYRPMRPQSSKISVRTILPRHSFFAILRSGRWSK